MSIYKWRFIYVKKHETTYLNIRLKDLSVLWLVVYFVLPLSALFTQVEVLAAVLALVVIIILSIIILIAVWRKVRPTLMSLLFSCKTHTHTHKYIYIWLPYVLRNLAMRSDGR